LPFSRPIVPRKDGLRWRCTQCTVYTLHKTQCGQTTGNTGYTLFYLSLGKWRHQATKAVFAVGRGSSIGPGSEVRLIEMSTLPAKVIPFDFLGPIERESLPFHPPTPPPVPAKNNRFHAFVVILCSQCTLVFK